jgi:pleckstrin homology domain-containing family F
MSPKKSFCVYASTSKEKIEWMMHISNCIEKLSKSGTPFEVAPQWIPDKEADICMRCRNSKFSLINRKVNHKTMIFNFL